MEVLYWLESIRTPALDDFFATVTYLGAEIAFMVLAVVLYWCFSKALGLYLLAVGSIGILANQALKLAFRIPRPWVKDPDFTIVEAARADATGYSFPSGHTQSAVGVYGCLARGSKKWWLRGLCVLAIALTAFSRMYLGVHTPVDVGVSLILGTVLVLALYPLKEKMERTPTVGLWFLTGLTALGFLYWAYAAYFPFPDDIDKALLAHGVENGAKLTGALLGMLLGCALEQRLVKASVAAPLLGQVLKVILGVGLLLVIHEFRFLPDFWRYWLMTFFAAGIWPISFGFFAKIGRKHT